MTKIPIYQIDTFTSSLFSGNPAAVCPLDAWPDDGVLQNIAAENNLSETAFFVHFGEKYHLRWFTPSTEIGLCGHGTLASAYVIFSYIDPLLEEIVFETRSGPLTVERKGSLIELDFPARNPVSCASSETLTHALGYPPEEVRKARDYLVVYDDEEIVRSLHPDFNLLKTLDCMGVAVTASSRVCDFVSRFFAPAIGIPEDPVTGSSHCSLVPYWAERLGKNSLHAMQLSNRGGELFCTHQINRVKIAGNAVLFMKGQISVPGNGGE